MSSSSRKLDGITTLDIDMQKELQEIHDTANLINSPGSKNPFIERNFLGMVGESAVNMEWIMKVLTERLKSKSLYKSSVVGNSKNFLSFQLGTNIDNSYAAIGHPSRIETEDQLYLLTIFTIQ